MQKVQSGDSATVFWKLCPLVVTTTHLNNTILSLGARLLNSVTLVLKAAVLLEGFIHQKLLSRVPRQRDQENIVGVTPVSIPKCVRGHVTVHREPSF